MIPAQQIRDAANEVLRDPAYADVRPGLGQRILDAVRDRLAQLLAEVLGSVGAGAVAQLVVLLLLVALVVAAVVVVRRLGRRGAVRAVDEGLAGLDVPALVARADAAAATGDLTAAVRSRYAALVLVLVERGVLEDRPGLTVGEVDTAVGVGLPAAAGLVAPAGRVLADVVYGARTADLDDDRIVARALAAVRSRRQVEA